jgi:hypothetical protein
MSEPLICSRCGGRLERDTESLRPKCFHCGTEFGDFARSVVTQGQDRVGKTTDLPVSKWELRLSEASQAYRLGVLSTMEYRDYLKRVGYCGRDVDILVTITERG